MSKLTKREKEMLRTAAQIRQVVYHDFMTKTANPAIMAVARALLPALKALGPKIMQAVGPMLKNPEFWVSVGPMVAKMLGQQSGESNEAPAPVSNQREVARTIAEAAVSAGVNKKNAAVAAKAIILACAEVGLAHQQKPQSKVIEALRLTAKMNEELEVIQEFM